MWVFSQHTRGRGEQVPKLSTPAPARPGSLRGIGFAASVFTSLPREPAGGLSCPSSWLQEEAQSHVKSCFKACGKVVN